MNIRKMLQQYTIKNNWIALLIFAVDYAIFFILIYWIFNNDNYYIKTLLSMLLGFTLGILFIVGHDCCHNSFTWLCCMAMLVAA
jgi:omega-6 fatty acid desaturase (delta-12 desaturase)